MPDIARKQLPQEVDQLMEALNLIQKNGWNKDIIPSVVRVMNKLTTLGKAIGYPPIEISINRIGEILKPYLAPPHLSIPQEELEILYSHILKLKENIALSVLEDIEIPVEETPIIKPIVIIALKDKMLATEIAHQIKYFNYRSIFCENLEAILNLQAADNFAQYGALLLDIDFCDKNNPEGLKTLSQQLPVLFVAHNSDTASRLFAVKAGGQAYFELPLEFTSLIEKIDQITTPITENSPYRILIIEDSSTQANIIRKNLDEAGMITEVLIDPLKISDTLSEFQPDLILLDLYMPLCSGLELAQVIRQQDLFMSIPIVFLSVEEDTTKQLNAIIGGGDDFLTKPLTPQYLTTAVTTRAKRYRRLRAGMTQDSLTGLLNHTRILEQLELEIARAKRHKTPLCFVMLDIDYFKNINDSHGHPVGDRVIKGLARLLKQQLRKTDNIGRYGGEEFAVILPYSEGDAVFEKFETIRRAFSKLVHRSADPTIEFSGTFSAGLVMLTPELQNVDALLQAADKALYIAKEDGRNCVIFYNRLL